MTSTWPISTSKAPTWPSMIWSCWGRKFNSTRLSPKTSNYHPRDATSNNVRPSWFRSNSLSMISGGLISSKIRSCRLSRSIQSTPHHHKSTQTVWQAIWVVWIVQRGPQSPRTHKSNLNETTETLVDVHRESTTIPNQGHTERSREQHTSIQPEMEESLWRVQEKCISVSENPKTPPRWRNRAGATQNTRRATDQVEVVQEADPHARSVGWLGATTPLRRGWRGEGSHWLGGVEGAQNAGPGDRGRHSMQGQGDQEEARTAECGLPAEDTEAAQRPNDAEEVRLSAVCVCVSLDREAFVTAQPTNKIS